MTEVKKMYVSLPMAGHEDTIAERVEKIISYCEQKYPEYDLIFPVNINDFIENGESTKREYSYGWYIGEDIKLLFDCDDILLTPGWRDSLGCKIEYDVATRRRMKTHNLAEWPEEE